MEVTRADGADDEPPAAPVASPTASPSAAPPGFETPPADRPRPESLSQLFWAFSGLALRGFGGVLPWAQRALVDERRWLSQEEFVELLAFGQLFPGPNIVNVSLMIGDRYFGWRGAVVAVLGMLTFPAVLVMSAALVYAQIVTHPVVRSALDGMAAAAAGMILGTAFKMARSYRKRWRWLAFAVASFVIVGLLHWPLIYALLLLAPIAILIAWRNV